MAVVVQCTLTVFLHLQPVAMYIHKDYQDMWARNTPDNMQNS